MSPSPKKKPSRKQVALSIFANDYAYGRDKIKGIIDYYSMHTAWDFHRNEYSQPFVSLESLKDWEGDGIIGEIYSEEDLERVRALKIPFVNTASSELAKGLPSVIIDNIKVGELAAEHLRGLDLDHFLFVGPSGLSYADQRFEGFQSALELSQSSCRRIEYASPTAEQSNISRASVRPSYLIEYLKDISGRVGVFASSDRVGYAVLEACRRLGLNSPEDVSVVGVDNDDIFCNLAYCSMSSINVDAHEIGFRAAQMLDQLMAGQEQSKHHIHLPPKGVFQRASTDNVRSKYPEVAQALRFIRNHSSKVIDVTNVMDVVPVSRRWLEVKFKEELGHGIYAEIRRIHVEHAQKLLATTEKSLSQIAQECGFTTRERMDYAFDKVLSLSPEEYRTMVNVSGK